MLFVPIDLRFAIVYINSYDYTYTAVGVVSRHFLNTYPVLEFGRHITGIGRIYFILLYSKLFF